MKKVALLYRNITYNWVRFLRFPNASGIGPVKLFAESMLQIHLKCTKKKLGMWNHRYFMHLKQKIKLEVNIYEITSSILRCYTNLWV
jgi:hypothetical protein